MTHCDEPSFKGASLLEIFQNIMITTMDVIKMKSCKTLSKMDFTRKTRISKMSIANDIGNHETNSE